MDSMSPVLTYTEHREMITCGAPWAASPHVFATGGKDPLIRVWDRRTPSCVGCFGALDSATGKVAVSSGVRGVLGRNAFHSRSTTGVQTDLCVHCGG